MTSAEIRSKLSGCWQVVRAELGGQPMPADAAEHVELRFTEETYRVSFGDNITDEGDYDISTNEPHLEISMIGKSGVNAGKTIPGIMQIAGDRLRICYALESTTPPSEFAAPSGTLHYLATYRRKT